MTYLDLLVEARNKLNEVILSIVSGNIDQDVVEDTLEEVTDNVDTVLFGCDEPEDFVKESPEASDSEAY